MTQHLMHESPLWSTDEVAVHLGVDKSTITRWVDAGILTALRVGRRRLAALAFDPDEVERVRRVRAGESGDVIDRVDVNAAAGDPCEDRSAYVRAEWLKAIRYVTSRTPDRTFHTGQVRGLVPDDAHGTASGALVAGLVRSRIIEHTGDYGESGDTRNRHGSTPCKVYRVVGELP